MDELKNKYASRDVEFIAMYVREPHAGERGFPNYRDHEDFAHKMEVAKELQEMKDVTLTIGVDDMSQEQHVRLGNLPNMAYVVDREGTVVYRNTWQHADDIDSALATLVTADDPSDPVAATLSTKNLGRGI